MGERNRAGTAEHERIKALDRKIEALRRTSETLKLARARFAQVELDRRFQVPKSFIVLHHDNLAVRTCHAACKRRGALITRSDRVALFEGYTTFEPFPSRSILRVEDQAGKGTQTRLRFCAFGPINHDVERGRT